jgi:Concanavalin A-like lectin/glucanases superfamily
MNGLRPFELVLLHRYADRRPHDLSGHGNRGYGELQAATGPGGRPSAAAFDGMRSRIFVPPSPSLGRPGGTSVDVVVNVAELGRRRTLVEGYLSFAVYVETDGAVGGSVLTAGGWSGIRSAAGLVPLGRWIMVTFTYTGDEVMALWVDGELVAEAYRRLGEGRGISWPFGLSIGAWPDADQRVLEGAIEEVKLWRPPPPPDRYDLS